MFVFFVAMPLIGAAVIEFNSDPGQVEVVLGAENQLSANDMSVLAGLGSHVQRFNAAALPLVADYTDPTVSASRWVRSAGRHIEEMRAAATAMEADVLAIGDNGVRETLLAMSAALRDEVGAVVELRHAVAHLDVKGQRAAVQRLRAAADKRHQQALEVLDQLRPYVDPATLRAILQEAVSQST